MKIITIILPLFLLICFSCKKEEQNICPNGLEEGRVIGFDFRKCACCSGWWIEIGGDTLRSFALPENIKIDNSNIIDGVSIPVCLSYEKAKECNIWDELIEVKEMKLQ